MPRPPSEQGTSSLPGLATDNVGYQTASSGSDEAATGLLEGYSGGHTPQDHTVSYSHNTSLNPRQPPALPPGAPTAAAKGLTLNLKSLALAVAEILHGVQNFKTGYLTLTTPLSGKIFLLAMVSQCTKYEVSGFTRY